MRRKLPIGIQTFREIREGDCYNVDKTGFALRLIEQGKYYFLSRPRRFGKSLFLDTLGELFSGNEPLFRGLHVHEHWDWQRRYPVIRLSFADGVLQSRAELNEKIGELLRAKFGIPSCKSYPVFSQTFVRCSAKLKDCRNFKRKEVFSFQCEVTFCVLCGLARESPASNGHHVALLSLHVRVGLHLVRILVGAPPSAEHTGGTGFPF